MHLRDGFKVLLNDAVRSLSSTEPLDARKSFNLGVTWKERSDSIGMACMGKLGRFWRWRVVIVQAPISRQTQRHRCLLSQIRPNQPPPPMTMLGGNTLRPSASYMAKTFACALKLPYY